MRKILFLFCLLFASAAVAQETIVLPSTFDETQMIVKKVDMNGNYIPLNQVADVSDNPKEQVAKIPVDSQRKQVVENIQVSEENVPQKRGGRLKFNDPQMQNNAENAVVRNSEEFDQTVKKAEQEGRVMVLKKHPVLFEEEKEQKPVEQKRVRKLRAIQKDYSIPKTTFGKEAFKGIEISKNSTFQTPTMTDALKDLRKESIRFEECNSNDPDCKMYEVDEEGQVIFK